MGALSLGLAIVAGLVTWGHPAAAQILPVGFEFQISVYSTNVGRPLVVADTGGNFVVVWHRDDGSLTGVFARRYNSAGVAQGTEFRVNTYTTSAQFSPGVAVDDTGGFVVVWGGYGPGGNAVSGQRFDSAGAVLGTEFQVSSSTTSVQRFPSVAMGGGGNFIVAWESGALGAFEIHARRFDSAGTPQGTEFQVNTYTTGFQRFADVGANPGGDFVVVWQSSGQDGDGYGIFGQRFDSAGSVLGSEFQVNTYTTGGQGGNTFVDIGVDGAGSFVVVWHSHVQDGGGPGIFGQRYDSAGTPQGSEFQVNTSTTGQQLDPAVAMDGDGNFFVVWEDLLAPSSIRGQGFDSGGAVLGTEFQVNAPASNPHSPSVGSDGAGNFVVVWQSYGSGYAVFGQRFTVLCGNGLIDGSANEQCDDGAANGSPGSCCAPDCTFKPNGTACTDDGNVCTNDICNGSSVVCQHASITGCEFTSQVAGSGGTVTTDTEADGATGSDRVETSVVTPNAGTVTIREGPINVSAPSGFTFFGQQVSITAPAATAPIPLRVTFELDVSLIPPGKNPTAVNVFRDGLVVPQCTGAPGLANPDPCLSSRVIQGDLDVRLTVLTSMPSEWNFGVEGNVLDHYKCYQGKDLKNPPFVKINAETDDQITAEIVAVQKVKFVCAPVDKNGEGILDADTHLVCYQVKGMNLVPRPAVEMSTQFQPSRFELKKPKLLCAPGVSTVLP
jgi:hypothetical protein